MIRIAELTQKDIGKWVVYRSYYGDKQETGKIKSWNSHFIFVVYKANNNWDLDHWKDYTAAATKEIDLFGLTIQS